MNTHLLAVLVSLAVPSFGFTQTKEPAPWTQLNFDTSPDKFTFAIHADLTGGERAGIFEVAMAQLAILRPDFVISVGDLIEGGEIPRDRFEAEWVAFDARVKDFPAPVFYVGGNHDLSTELSREIWAERYGPTYYHFRYKNVLFLVLDTEDTTPKDRTDIARLRAEAVEVYKSQGHEAFEKTSYAAHPHRSAGTISTEQASYFEEVLNDNQDVRWTFLFLHKPAWKRTKGNPFSTIEAALKNRPYTVFNGHVQAMAHETRQGRDYIQLASTGGEQFPDIGVSEDHVTLVTMTSDGLNIANLMLSGIRDKTGSIPINGDALCFSTASCESK